jgi:hypothetical protein
VHLKVYSSWFSTERLNRRMRSDILLLLAITRTAFLSHECAASNVQTNGSTSTSNEAGSEYWDLNTRKGIMKGQNIRMRKLSVHGSLDSSAYSTCYEAVCSGRSCPSHEKDRTIRFCYPSVIVTGLPKCGTSAMYDFLARFPGAILMHEKENCPYTRRRPHWVFFQSLPKYESITSKSLIIDGCIEVQRNLIMRLAYN